MKVVPSAARVDRQEWKIWNHAGGTDAIFMNRMRSLNLGINVETSKILFSVGQRDWS